MFCWFQIGDGPIRRASGTDPLGALYMAMKTVAMLLNQIRETKDSELHWKGAITDGDLGLPVFYPA